MDSIQAGGVTNGRISLVDYSATRCAGGIRKDGWPHVGTNRNRTRKWYIRLVKWYTLGETGLEPLKSWWV